MKKNPTPIFILVFILSACGYSVVPHTGMVPQQHVYQQLPDNSPFRHSIVLGGVEVPLDAGGHEAPVHATEFRKALEQALVHANLQSNGHAKYTMNAEMLALSVPSFGPDRAAATQVRYHVVRIKDGHTVFDEVVALPAEAEHNKFYDLMHRARLSVAKAIRGNIEQMLMRLTNSPA